MRKITCFTFVLSFLFSSFAAEERGTIEREFDPMGFLKPVPVSISGFSGEVDSVLKNDLLFMGVVNVPLDQVKYLVTGSNSGRVEGGVTDKITKHAVMP